MNGEKYGEPWDQDKWKREVAELKKRQEMGTRVREAKPHFTGSGEPMESP